MRDVSAFAPEMKPDAKWYSEESWGEWSPKNRYRIPTDLFDRLSRGGPGLGPRVRKYDTEAEAMLDLRVAALEPGDKVRISGVVGGPRDDIPVAAGTEFTVQNVRKPGEKLDLHDPKFPTWPWTLALPLVLEVIPKAPVAPCAAPGDLVEIDGLWRHVVSATATEVTARYGQDIPSTRKATEITRKVTPPPVRLSAEDFRGGAVLVTIGDRSFRVVTDGIRHALLGDAAKPLVDSMVTEGWEGNGTGPWKRRVMVSPEMYLWYNPANHVAFYGMTYAGAQRLPREYPTPEDRKKLVEKFS